jgi:hypothetical protein
MHAGDWDRSRKVFYSNSADPLIREIFGSAPAWVSGALAFLRKENDMAAAIPSRAGTRRWSILLKAANSP